jgi:SpoU rRNA Methylase family
MDVELGVAVVAEVGVGPWPGPWPADPRYDPDLLRAGDRRNVVDGYRYWTVDAIRADLDRRRHLLHVAVENWEHDLNIGSVVRTANAFNVAAVHIVGRRRWNRRGAMVTDRYLHVVHHPDVAALVAWAAAQPAPRGVAPDGVTPGGVAPDGVAPDGVAPDGVAPDGVAGLPLLGVDNPPCAVPIEGFALPAACVLLFGQEGPGLSAEAVAACSAVLAITQYGSTRSINAGAAAAIAMHAWARAHAAPVRAGLPRPAGIPG